MQMASYLEPFEKGDPMKKWIIALTTLLIAICALAGCSGNNNSNASSNTNSTTSNLKKDEIKIDQIDWKVENAVVDKHRRVVFSYTNKSKFKIAELEMDFSPKSDTTPEKLREACEIYRAEGWSDSVLDQISSTGSSEMARFTLAGEWEKTVAPGETSGEEGMTIGIKYINGMEQYDLFEPSMMIINYVAADGKLYEEVYDYKTKTYSLSDKGIDTRQWSDSELAGQLPRPENLLIDEINENDTNFKFETFGTTSADFKDYVSACKEKGFTKEVQEKSGLWDEFKAKSADGKYALNLSLDVSTGNLSVRIESI